MSGGFNLRQANASLGAHRAVLEFADPVQGGHIDQHSALKGHQLAIITGGATAQGQRQLLRYAGGNQLPQLFLVARTDHRVRLLSFQLLVEHRAEPVEIAGKTFDLRWL